MTTAPCECPHCQAQRTPWARSVVAERDALRVENAKLHDALLEMVLQFPYKDYYLSACKSAEAALGDGK